LRREDITFLGFAYVRLRWAHPKSFRLRSCGRHGVHVPSDAGRVAKKCKIEDRKNGKSKNRKLQNLIFPNAKGRSLAAQSQADYLRASNLQSRNYFFLLEIVLQ
jgi:hypothetical protein